MGVRSYTCYVVDEKGRPIAEAWCRAFSITDPANPILVETQYSSATGSANFVALPDNAPVDVWATWGGQTTYFRNVLSSTGAAIDVAVFNTHVQNTDLYAKGYRTGASFPALPATGEVYLNTS